MNDEETEKPTVSDHAVLRYAQRIMGMNTDHVHEKLKHSDTKLIKWLNRVGLISIEGIKEEILNDNLVKLINKFGPNLRYNNKRYIVVVKENKVITIIK